MNGRAAIAFQLIKFCFIWPLVVVLLPKDNEARKQLATGFAVGWRSLWLSERNLFVTPSELNTFYQAAVAVGDRKQAQQMLDRASAVEDLQ